MLPLSIADARAIALAPVAIDIFFPRYVESAVEGEKKREKCNYLCESQTDTASFLSVVKYCFLASFAIVNSVSMTLLIGDHDSRSFLGPYPTSVGI